VWIRMSHFSGLVSSGASSGIRKGERCTGRRPDGQREGRRLAAQRGSWQLIGGSPAQPAGSGRGGQDAEATGSLRHSHRSRSTI
jgi:hypothetical protein